MFVYKLTISYDGTDYFGWQIQKDRKTIQGELTHVFKKVVPHKFRLIGASRTDRGVHATGQVASLHIQEPLKMEPERFKRVLNAQLPRDIYISSIEKAKDNFHARFSAKGKIYRYTLRKGRNPFTSRYEWQIEFDLNVGHLEKLANFTKGTFDFSHIHIGNTNTSPVVKLFYTKVEKSGDKLILYIAGERFIYKLVRILVGEMVYNSRKSLDINDYVDFLNKNKPKNFHIAPPNGLSLINVFY